MREIETSNHLIGNREALEAKFKEDGFFVFKNVLDLDALKRLQSKYREVLEERGMIKPGDEEFKFIGGDQFSGRFMLHDSDEWKVFANNPKIKGFVEGVMGEKIEWVPIVEYRANRPIDADMLPDDPFMFWHCDGHYNPGLPLVSMWFPLSDIDEKVGGIALHPGLLDGPHLYSPEPKIKTEPVIIPNASRDPEVFDMSRMGRYNFKLGDVVIFDRRTFHSGLYNVSDRLRLSMDIRFVRDSENTMLIGKLISSENNVIKIESHDDGHIETLRITPDTYLRETISLLPMDAFERSMPVGTDVIVARENGIATTVTHLHPPEKPFSDRGPALEKYI